MNQKPNYSLAIKSDISSINDTYVNARYAPVGNEQVGIPFPAFRDYGSRMTQFQPSSLSMSTLKKQMNLPTNNTYFRSGITENAIGTGNEGLKNWVYASQTLSNPSLDTMFCTSTTDCGPLGPNYTCNSNFETWPDSYGNQSGSVCNYTAYPEIDSGSYVRKLASEGGIGKACTEDSDCASGYECNNETDSFGKNIQQTGYCSQVYTCADDKKRYMGYPYNSGIPLIPEADQNNNGAGYKTLQECQAKASAQQNCVPLNGSFYAVYPGFCPVSASLRVGGPQGALQQTSAKSSSVGFQIPAYATNRSSNMGGTNTASKAFSAFNRNLQNKNGMSEASSYEMSLNPKPSNA